MNSKQAKKLRKKANFVKKEMSLASRIISKRDSSRGEATLCYQNIHTDESFIDYKLLKKAIRG